MSWPQALAVPVIRSAFRLFGGPGSQCLSILVFHRVLPRRDGMLSDVPDADRFDQLMRLVASSFHVLTLGAAVTLLQSGTLPPRALVITFDDGYADNAEIALPILLRHGLRATFFVSSGFLDGGRMWNDSVIECIRACTRGEVDASDLGLGSYPLASVAERRSCIDGLLAHIKYLDLAARDAAVQHVRRITAVKDLPEDLMMTSDQVRALQHAGMEIGAHTVNHPILTSLSAVDAEYELAAGRDHLQALIDAPVNVMAYPNGRPTLDYDTQHVEMVMRLGFRAAVSTAPGAARAGDDLFQLPRFTPWDRSTLAWSARLLLNQRTAISTARSRQSTSTSE